MRLRLSTDDLPERDRVAFWHDAVCKDMFNVTTLGLVDAAGFRASADVQVAGRFVVAELESSHGSVEKTAADVARGPGDSVLVYVAVEAGQRYEVGPDGYPLEPGDVCIVPMDRRFQGFAGSMAFRSLLIPGAVLGPLTAGRGLERARHLPAGSPFGALLGATLAAAAAQLPRLDGETGDALLANLSGLVALALGASDEGRSAGRDALRASRLDAARRHVDRHLADPLLDPARTAAALGMSVRQLHLLFRPTGETFARYLTRRRLEACRATLSGPRAVGRSVADVAFGWGFNSLSVFYRAFADAFATSPGDVRAEAAARAVEAAGG